MVPQRQKVGWWDWGGGCEGCLFNGYRVLVWEDENFLEIDGGDGCSTF